MRKALAPAQSNSRLFGSQASFVPGSRSAVPPFAAWINATFGGPALPAIAVSVAGVVFGSLLSPRDTTSDAQRVAAVLAARGAVVDGVKGV